MVSGGISHKKTEHPGGIIILRQLGHLARIGGKIRSFPSLLFNRFGIFVDYLISTIALIYD